MGRFSFRLPDVGEGTAEAEIVAWHVAPGDTVEEDQPLVDVMTDKATVEITSPVAGRVVERRGEPGEMFAVGGVLVEFETEGGAAVPAEPPLVSSPSGERNTEAREAPPTTPATERPGSGPSKPVVEQQAVAQAMTPAPDMLGEGDYVFRLPDVGEGTAEAEIVAWHVKVGDAVEEDQPLVDVMTDKATVEITSPVTGRVASVHGEPGRMAPVGSTLVVFSTGGVAETEDAAAPVVAEPPARPALAANPARAPAFFESPADRPLTSPAIRRRAKEQGVRLEAVKGTGPGGRITREDFEAHRQALAPASKSPAPLPSSPDAARDGVEEVRVIGLRRKIAEKMAQSKRRIPHFGYVDEVDVTELDELRVHLNATKSAERPKLTLLPFLIRALVRVLPAYPQINATYDDEAGVVRRYAAVHLGMATQTPNGLIVPVIRHAETRDVWALATEIGRLAEATRKGTATREELSGSSITLTSLGPLGGVSHTPVINHPEVAIIGPNKIIERPVVRQGKIAVRKMMNISSSFDHRVVDGYDAAEFIQKIKGLLEHPATLFMD